MTPRPPKPPKSPPPSSSRCLVASSLSSSKSALRARVRALPGATDAESLANQRALLASDLWAAAFNIALYRSLPGEPATDLLFADAARLGMDIQYPAARPGGKTYAWRRLTDKTTWRPGPHGIDDPDPATTRPGRPGDLRLVIVPGLAFDATGRRLGHGTGAYDRLLAQCPDALLLALCPASRLLPPDTSPSAPHDIPVDAILTNGRFHFLPTSEAKLARLFGFPPDQSENDPPPTRHLSLVTRHSSSPSSPRRFVASSEPHP
jgi:5-formyltetrahydrofolate cyclo-ligase